MPILASLCPSDFYGPNTSKYLAGAAIGSAWLYYTQGNIMVAGAGYYLYSRVVKKPAAQQAGGPAPFEMAAAAATAAVTTAAAGAGAGARRPKGS